MERVRFLVQKQKKDGSKADVTDKAEWLTSDKSVATVINGIITAVAPGSTTIYIKKQKSPFTISVNKAPFFTPEKGSQNC
ncbi:UNVERIFIED_CONTAM: hypothetical protein ABID98_000257 [Brevibacillus sp. OAP136]